MRAAEPEDQNCGEHGGRNSSELRFSWVVARPGPGSVLDSTHAPWFDESPLRSPLRSRCARPLAG
ncbi:MAG: hypothetical protein ACRDPO_02975 [Streptosporangiaceae bacterium]